MCRATITAHTRWEVFSGISALVAAYGDAALGGAKTLTFRGEHKYSDFLIFGDVIDPMVGESLETHEMIRRMVAEGCDFVKSISTCQV
jgi:hypothetical protein